MYIAYHNLRNIYEQVHINVTYDIFTMNCLLCDLKTSCTTYLVCYKTKMTLSKNSNPTTNNLPHKKKKRKKRDRGVGNASI